jgi:predicted nuclease with RNAse H fold
VNTINVEYVSKKAMIEYNKRVFSIFRHIMVQVSVLETYPRAKMNLFKILIGTDDIFICTSNVIRSILCPVSMI